MMLPFSEMEFQMIFLGFQEHDPFDDIIGAEIQITAAASGVVPDDSFTVTQAVNSLGFGKFQIILSFVTGLCWMADSMEVMILSILSPALHCEWGVSQYKQALLTTIVFIGMMFSSAFWGHVSDKVKICILLLTQMQPIFKRNYFNFSMVDEELCFYQEFIYLCTAF